MDFDFKWYAIAMIFFGVVGFSFEAYKDYNKTQLEIAKLKCERK